MRVINRLLGRHLDEGFTLVELMVAAGVMATALAMMAGVLTSSLSATGLARERQSATGLADQVVEQLRSLPMATLEAGLGSNDLATTTDPAITKGVGANCQNANSGYTYNGETIKCTYHSVQDTPALALVPHIQNNVAVGPTKFTVATYLTYYNNNLTSGTYRATAIVSWTSAVAGNSTRSVQAQTIMYAPFTTGAGCNDPTHHHIPGPCQAGFTADAVQTPATTNITGTVGSMTLDHVTLTGGRVTSDMAAEQTTTVKGSAQASGAELQLAGQPSVDVGSSLATASADNDPEGTLSAYGTQSFSSPAAAVQSLTDVNGNALNVNVATGDTGTATSTTMANTSTPYNCPNMTTYPSPYTGNENDNLPCGGSTQKTVASGTAQASLTTIGTVPVAAVVGSAFTSTAVTDINSAPATGRCTGTSGDGCSRAQLTRAAADTDAGGLPSNLNAALKPAGFTTYFAQITGITDAVTAEAGIGTAAPSATQSAGNVKVYCTSVVAIVCPTTGYVTLSLAAITQVLTTPTLVITDASLGGGTTISLSATIKPATTATTSSCSGTCTRTSATATSTPPTVTVNETITVAGHTVLNTSTVLDPGPTSASTSYVSASTS